ncbi:hypothetical protein ALC56_11056 [Trachymyrmex septentrionalis]|uniref:Uncharacterized protein n=1 Tax=Trachymyrmex septentrionalis TaxID=34720 RepID=A0A195F276_9HYME|nr:hypothetical protein ALC56_11056 [Trachymyrmex septentrionalis]
MSHLLLGSEYRGVPDCWSSSVEIATMEPNHHWPLVVLTIEKENLCEATAYTSKILFPTYRACYDNGDRYKISLPPCGFLNTDIQSGIIVGLQAHPNVAPITREDRVPPRAR